MDSLSPEQPSLRRADDGGYLRAKLRTLVGSSDAPWHPAGGGRLLLLATGVVTTTLTPLTNPDLGRWRVLLGVAVAMTALLLGSYLVPWDRLPRRATLAFPLSVWVALGVLGIWADGLGANFTGMIAVGFAYIGLTQTKRTSVMLTLPAIVAFLASYGRWSTTVAMRLPIAIVVWLILAVVLTELIERQAELRTKLHTAAHTDALTGVANRRDLEHRLHAMRPGDTLVMCDLDNFKHLNDTQGHAAGDRVLANFGTILLASLRENDYAARYGGEEFAVFLPATDLAQAHATLRRLRSRWQVLQPDVTFSAGIAVCRADRDASETLHAADTALYRAKAAGRNRDDDEVSIETVFYAASRAAKDRV